MKSPPGRPDEASAIEVAFSVAVSVRKRAVEALPPASPLKAIKAGTLILYRSRFDRRECQQQTPLRLPRGT